MKMALVMKAKDQKPEISLLFEDSLIYYLQSVDRFRRQ